MGLNGGSFPGRDKFVESQPLGSTVHLTAWQRIVEHFTLEQMIRKYVGLYKSVA